MRKLRKNRKEKGGGANSKLLPIIQHFVIVRTDKTEMGEYFNSGIDGKEFTFSFRKEYKNTYEIVYPNINIENEEDRKYHNKSYTAFTGKNFYAKQMIFTEDNRRLSRSCIFLVLNCGPRIPKSPAECPVCHK